jgi:hypothetical protein
VEAAVPEIPSLPFALGPICRFQNMTEIGALAAHLGNDGSSDDWFSDVGSVTSCNAISARSD